MAPSVAERIGHNESVIRKINERIEAGLWPTGETAVFCCECAVLRCTELVEMALDEYERVRSDPRWFLVVPGHEIAGHEVVVHEGDGYLIVEKVGEAAAQAEAEDPRDDAYA